MRTFRILPISLLLVMWLSPGHSRAQITFQKTYSGFQRAESLQPATGGGYIIAGSTNSFGAGGNDGLLVRIDPYGDTLWTRTFGGVGEELIKSVQQTSDNGFILCGRTSSFGAGGHDVYLLKTDSLGNLIWSKTYGGTGTDYGWSVQQTTDSGFVITGQTTSFGAGQWDIYLIKTDFNGDTLWTKTYGDTDPNQGWDVRQTSDGGYVITGNTIHPIIFTTVMAIIKTDSIGNITWMKTYDINNPSYGHSIAQTFDNGFIVTGYAFDKMYLLKADASGIPDWIRTFDITGGGLYGQDVRQTADSGFVLAGYSTALITENIYLIKTGANGDTLWTKTFGGNGVDEVYSITESPDAGHLFAGITSSFNGGLYIIKTDSAGKSGCNEISTNLTLGSPIIITSNMVLPISSGAVIGNPATITGNASFSDSTICMDCDTLIAGFNHLVSSLTVDITDNSSGANGWLWDFGDGDTSVVQSPSHTYAAPGTYNVCLNVTNPCGQDSVCDSITVTMSADSVWPGDADHNGIAINTDILPIGIGYNFTGLQRPAATLNWQGQYCPDWSASFVSGLNYKYADCNGDSIISEVDANVILLNYGFTHSKYPLPNQAAPIDPLIYPWISTDSVPAGAFLTIPVMLGDSANPIDSIYGIAFTINYDQNLVDSDSVFFSVDSSWLGDPATNLIYIDTNFYGNGQLDVGITRIDQLNASGYGQIAEIGIGMQDDISGKDTISAIFHVWISDVTAITLSQDTVVLQQGADSAVVWQLNTGLADLSYLEQRIKVYPNPAKDRIYIYHPDADIQGLELIHITGRTIFRGTSGHAGRSFIETAGYAPGVYLMRIKTAKGTLVKKVSLY